MRERASCPTCVIESFPTKTGLQALFPKGYVADLTEGPSYRGSSAVHRAMRGIIGRRIITALMWHICMDFYWDPMAGITFADFRFLARADHAPRGCQRAVQAETNPQMTIVQ